VRAFSVSPKLGFETANGGGEFHGTFDERFDAGGKQVDSAKCRCSGERREGSPHTGGHVPPLLATQAIFLGGGDDERPFGEHPGK